MAFISSKPMPAELLMHDVEEWIYQVDQLKVRGLSVIPKERRKITRIVVYLRGGKGHVGRVRLARLLQFISPHTLVFAPYYRGSNGSEGRDAFAGDDLKDVEEAVSILKSFYPTAYLHLIGFSRGGIQGLLTFQKVKADSYMIWGGVTDLHLMYEERVDLRGMLRRMVGHPKKDKEAYELRNAIKSIDHQSPPILIIHGAKDMQVSIRQAAYLEAHLKQVGAYFKTMYQCEEGHVPRPEAMKKVLNTVHQWMNDIEQDRLA
ncbi:alpha/beta hydrolase family protein [Staphylococcus felis]|uniref:alpha/beta hydrolase family protein n=1 Tax=Staphylococcus felis TaxID=46127 RepID=UPI001EE98E00|nr:prolyl oligopeptidase family serine peptidase [Staphylococcus felis]